MKTLFFLLIFVSLFTRCTSCPNSESLVGKYSYKKNKISSVKDSIFIYKDGTYKHQFSTASGQIFQGNGKWSYDSVGCEILFKNFEFFTNEGPSGPKGNWFSRIKIENNEIKLMYSSEDNIYFSKAETNFIKSPPREYKGAGSMTKEISLTGDEVTLKLSYEFYKESDNLIVYDQNGKELHRTGMRSTTKTETVTMNLSSVTKLIFKIEGKSTTSQWRFSVEVE